MSRKLIPGYRFDTEAQWKSCLFLGADRETREGRGGLRPFAPYSGPTARFETKGAYAPAITDAKEVLWRDREGHLQRLAHGDDVPRATAAPSAIAQATRLIATPTALWAADGNNSLQAFDVESLTSRFVADLPNLEVLDIAGDERDGVYALVACNAGRSIVHVDHTGHLTASFRLPDLTDASALVYLARSSRLVVLASGASKLYWFDVSGGPPTFKIAIGAVRPCFDVVALGSDGCARLFLGGTDGTAFGGRSQLLTLDSDGSLLGAIELLEPPTGIAANRAHLYVTTDRGLLQFDPAATIPRGSAEVKVELLSPILRQPAEDVHRWLRIDATVTLPNGCALEISYASTSNAAIHSEAMRLSADSPVPQWQRIEQIRQALGPWRRFSFHGGGAAHGEAEVLSAPLFDVREPYLCVHIALIASPGGGIPMLSRLAVLYDRRTLIENLPAIYRRGEAEPEDFLRPFVGVLEATTHTLDERIADLGRNIHPQTAQDNWLDYIARWLDLPWDDAMSTDQKRRIVSRATDIAHGYGTRSGLEALLESLVPGTPRRFRIVDTTVEFGLAMLGDDTLEGSRLPAILAGLPRTATELGNKAILGCARLPGPDSEPEAARFVGHIRIDIAASAAEREAWRPWLLSLIEAMLPATSRAELRWFGTLALPRTMQLDEGLALDHEPTAHLGTDAVTGIARLAGKRSTTLSRDGLGSNSSLQ